jgi:hypothetical protein
VEYPIVPSETLTPYDQHYDESQHQRDAERLISETEAYLQQTTFEALSVDAANDPLSVLAASNTITMTKYSMPTGPETDEPDMM